MTVLRYELPILVMDDLRAVFGLLIFGSPLVFLETVPWITVSLSAVTLVFVLYLCRCAIRHRTSVVISDTTIEIRALTVTQVEWSAINHVELRYYSPRRRSGKGWMQLRLSDGAGKIVIESGLQEFQSIARKVARIIGQNRLDVSVTTRANFKAMEIDLPVTEQVG